MGLGVNLDIWTFPLSLILAIAALLAVVVASRRLATSGWALGTLLATLLFIGVEGTWAGEWYHSWPFIVLQLLLLVPLGKITWAGLKRRTSWYATFSHAGLFLVVWGGLFGAPDVSDAQMVVTRQQAEHLSYTPSGKILPLPFEVQLQDFQIDYYEDGQSPKQFTSTLLIDGQEFQTSVNHPCSYHGWDIYQADYDVIGQQYSVLKVVHDPWLPVVYAGMLLLTIGAVLGLRQSWSSGWFFPVIALITIAFTVLSLARINLGTLMPALRSIWFLPHILIYMIAYSILAVASVWGLWEWRNGDPATGMSHRLLVTASSLLLIGMLCGAVWAKEAWGQYWTWDAKECWAAVTWLLTLIAAHLQPRYSQLGVVVVIWISFLAMQITWYGVNYLPAAQHSMHTYNS